MAVVDIGGTEYTVYADISTADEYAAAAYHAGPWRDLDEDDTKARLLVTMTRVLDRQRWRGDKTSDDQDLAWPRKDTGVSGVEDDTIPEDIVHGCIEGAIALADGATLQTAQNVAQKLQQIRAGSVSLTYFRGAEGRPNRFPLIVQELLRDYLAGQIPTLTGKATGTGGTSSTDEDLGHSSPI